MCTEGCKSQGTFYFASAPSLGISSSSSSQLGSAFVLLNLHSQIILVNLQSQIPHGHPWNQHSTRISRVSVSLPYPFLLYLNATSNISFPFSTAFSHLGDIPSSNYPNFIKGPVGLSLCDRRGNAGIHSVISVWTE